MNHPPSQWHIIKSWFFLRKFSQVYSQSPEAPWHFLVSPLPCWCGWPPSWLYPSGSRSTAAGTYPQDPSHFLSWETFFSWIWRIFPTPSPRWEKWLHQENKLKIRYDAYILTCQLLSDDRLPWYLHCIYFTIQSGLGMEHSQWVMPCRPRGPVQLELLRDTDVTGIIMCQLWYNNRCTLAGVSLCQRTDWRGKWKHWANCDSPKHSICLFLILWTLHGLTNTIMLPGMESVLGVCVTDCLCPWQGSYRIQEHWFQVSWQYPGM